MRASVGSLLVVLALGVESATAQSISLNNQTPPAEVTVAAASAVAVAIAGGPGNTTDWLALYPTGASDSGYLSWSYLSGSTTPPSSGLTSATLSRTAPVAAGSYEWRLFANNSYTRIATSAVLTVTASPAVVTVNGAAGPNPASAVAGASIAASIADGPANVTDWVALAPFGSPDSTVIDWRYLNSTTVAPTTGLASGTVSFLAPVTPGSYEVRFFANGTYGRLATSGVITVSASPAAVTVNGGAPPAAVPVNAGTYANVAISDGPGNPGDWVGLYAANAADSALLSWRYLNGSTTLPVSGFTAGTLHFVVPTIAGTYEFRFFMDGSYGRLATSGAMVVPQTPAQIAVNGTAPPTSVTVAPASNVAATISGGPGNTTDWVALAAQGAPDASFLAWQYLNGSTVAPTTGLPGGELTFALPAAAGTYEVRLYASNSYQCITTSATIVASSAPPVVTIALTSPFPGTTFNAPASLVVAAHATATGGTIQQVTFYDGATAIGTATTAPYQITWTAPTQGLHVLTAAALDQTNAITTSTPAVVTIAPGGTTQGVLAAPVANPPGGAIAAGQLVTLTAAPGTTVHFTTDGSLPDQASPLYSGPVAMSQSSVLRARAYQSGWTESVPSSDIYVIDTAPPTIVATVSPGANAAGWNNTPVTVSFECADTSAVASCPQPVSVTQQGAGQLVTVTAEDALGHQSSLSVTINIDSVAPMVTLSSPTADLSTTDAALLLSGTVTDTGSGVARAQCGGQLAALSGASASCTVPLAPGQNTVVLAAVDVAGNSSSAGLRATRETAATAIVIAPTSLALAVGDIRGLTVTTDAGVAPSGLVWTSSNPSIVSIAPDNDGTIVAEALGEATVTATVGSLTSQATVRVLAGAVAPGEAIWTAAPILGRQLQAPLRANPVRDDDPDLFSVEVDPVTSGTVAKAIRGADGATLWSEAVDERPVADAFGGFLARSVGESPDPSSYTTTLRRVGGGGIAPWEYVTEYIPSVASSSDGTVYLTEIVGSGSFPASPRFPSGGGNFRSVIVALDGRTGAVKFRVPLPVSTWRFPDRLSSPDGCPVVNQNIREQGSLGAISVMPNGDAYVQHTERHLHWATACPGDTTGTASDSFTLRLWRVTPSGAVTSHTIADWSGTWPMDPDGSYDNAGQEYFWEGVNRPDGRGGALATWHRFAYDGTSTLNESRVATVSDAGVLANRLAPWAENDAVDRLGVMVTNDGTIYHRDEPNAETIARSTETWAPQWTAPSFGTLIQGLANGGMQWLTWDGATTVLQERDASGLVIDGYPTAISPFSSPLIVLRDQDLLHGLDLDGALAMVAAPSTRANEWTYSSGQSNRCTPGRLYRDLPVADSPHIGLVPNAVYSYDLIDTPANPTGQFQSFQGAGVKDAFKEWNDTSTAENLTRAFRIRTDEERQQNVQPSISVRKVDLGTDDNGRPRIGAFPPPDNHPGRDRITGGAMLLTTNTAYLSQEEGYKLAAMHETGHALGLAHPTSFVRGGTVMNVFYIPQSPQNILETRDDRVGRNLARHPTSCDVEAVRAAQTP